MFSKTYTAVLRKNDQTTVVNIDTIPDYDRASRDIQEKHPGFELIALIPGRHADWSFAYSNETKVAQRNDKKADVVSIDVWDTTHLNS